MDNTLINLQAYVAEQCRLVETLLAQQPVLFQGRTVGTTEDAVLSACQCKVRIARIFV